MALDNVEVGDIIEYLLNEYIIIEVYDLFVWLYNENNRISSLCGTSIDFIKKFAYNIKPTTNLVKEFDNQLSRILENQELNIKIVECQKKFRKKYKKLLNY